VNANDELARLAALAGIEAAYHDIQGVQHRTSPAVQRALLQAMRLGCATSGEVRESAAMLQRRTLCTAVPPLSVLRMPKLILGITLPDTLVDNILQWRCEDFRSKCDLKTAVAHDVGTFEGVRYRRYAVPLPSDIPLGYHTVDIATHNVEISARIAVTPAHAFRPRFVKTGERLWGLACHLYGIRSDTNWGIGDFGDLLRLGEVVGRAGGAALAINPLHALFLANPEQSSPYWPSSRHFLNPLYIDLRSFPELHRDSEAVLDDKVNYRRVAASKMAAFRRMQEHVLELTPKTFLEKAPRALRLFACHSVLSEHFGGTPWHRWPATLRNPESSHVKAWAESHASDLRFHMSLQWLADDQLHRARAANLRIGLVRDLAVGASPDGADVWADQNLFAIDASFGAPPDPFAAEGQDWGMPPIDPLALTARGFEPFIALLRANMTHAGALRIDHIIGLQRLFWMPKGGTAADGAYVRYPMDDLFGLLALESHLNQCFVIGEDLGTVPEGFRARMERECLLSTRLFFFERYANGLFKRPETYPPASVAQATTHDLPTVSGFWEGIDIPLQKIWNKDYDSAKAEALRHQDRSLVVAALVDQGFLEQEAAAEHFPAMKIIHAIHCFLARAPSVLALINLSDVMAMKDQLNVPGTTAEYPNWRMKLPQSIEELEESELWRATVDAIKRERAMKLV
jgi:4-alpha-glucanotransferase